MPDDYEYYPYGPFGSWKNRTAQGATLALTSDDFGQIKLVEYYEQLASRFGRNFKNIRKFAPYFLLFHDGAQHKLLRKAAAIQLREVAEDIAAFEAQTVAEFKKKFAQTGRLEIVSELIEPLAENMTIAVSGLDYIKGIGSVLVADNSLKVIQHIDNSIGRLFEMSLERFPEASELEHGIRVAYTMLGAEPFAATVSQSLAKVFRGASGELVSDLGWTGDFPETALKTLFRQCKHQPVDLGGKASSVSSIEIDIETFLHGDSPNPRHIFGVGSHACLGRRISLTLWGKILRVLRECDKRVRFIEEISGGDKLLVFPSRFEIELY